MSINRVNAINIYFGENRKYLLMTLNIVLFIFIILEVMIWNDVSNLITEEEYRIAKMEMCAKDLATGGKMHQTCRK